MKTGQIKQLQAAGFSELWRDPDNGQLYIREHAWNVLRARRNERKGYAASSEGLKQESVLCQGTKAHESETVARNEGRGALADSEQGRSDTSSSGEEVGTTPPLSNERPSELSGSDTPPLAKEEVEAVKPGQSVESCNRHTDCEAAEIEFEAKRGHKPNLNFHCHDETCEDCFGC